MNEKEFVLVSQGIEIYRTKSQEDAVNMVKKENDEYFDYRQRCADNYERPADNYIDLEIEYSNEKEKDKEIERLNNIINELEKWLEQEYAVVKANSIQEPNNPEWYIKWNERKNTLNKLQELKGSSNNE